MLFAQSMFSSEVVFGTTIAMFLVLLAIDLWSAPSCSASEDMNDAAGQRTSSTKGSAGKVAQNH